MFDDEILRRTLETYKKRGIEKEEALKIFYAESTKFIDLYVSDPENKNNHETINEMLKLKADIQFHMS